MGCVCVDIFLGVVFMLVYAILLSALNCLFIELLFKIFFTSKCNLGMISHVDVQDIIETQSSLERGSLFFTMPLALCMKKRVVYGVNLED